MSKAAAEYLVEALEKAGVQRVYGVVGDSLNGFTDAMRRRKSIDWIHMRHEEAAAFAAGAEAHLRENLRAIGMALYSAGAILHGRGGDVWEMV